MYFLTFLSALFLPLNNIGAKLNKTDGSAKILSIAFLVGLAGVISWCLCLFCKQTVTKDMFLYALLFALFYIVGTMCGLTAYQKGSLSGTSLFSNASLVVVVLFSTLYFKEPLTPISIIGVLGVLTALVLLSLPDEKPSNDEKRGFNFVWLLLCIGMLACNSLISICSKLRQTSAGGENAFAFMAVCFTFTFVLSIITYAVWQIKNRSAKDDFLSLKNSLCPLCVQAVGNTGSNLLVTFLTSRVNASILYPVNMGGGLVITVLCGFIFFKDKPNLKNIVGILLGITAMILLNL